MSSQTSSLNAPVVDVHRRQQSHECRLLAALRSAYRPDCLDSLTCVSSRRCVRKTPGEQWTSKVSGRIDDPTVGQTSLYSAADS